MLVQMGILEIDSQGRIWRVMARTGNRWSRGVNTYPCKRKRAESKDHYMKVSLRIQGKRVFAMAHRLVWRHFNGPIPPGLTINHKNGKTQENDPTNLELATYSEQQKHAETVLGWERKRDHKGQFLGLF